MGPPHGGDDGSTRDRGHFAGGFLNALTGPRIAEQYRASEAGVARIRLMVAVFTSIMFAFVRGPEPLVWLGLAVIAVALAYSVWVLWARPFERYPFMASSLFVSATDLALITLFLVATGGFASPYFPLWYVSIFAVSLRFGFTETMLGASLYTLAYAGITVAMDSLVAQWPTFIVRSGYIYLAGLLGVLASALINQETVQRRRYEKASTRLEEALSLQEATFDATADGLLVVDMNQNVMAYNERFQEMTGVQGGLPRDHTSLIEKVQNQMENPEQFMKDIKEAYKNPQEESFDEIRFKDGRIFERYSRPQLLNDEPVGRVWSFRNVTATRNAWNKLKTANEELERYANAAAEELRFAHAAAHDLKEPARMVTNYLTLLKDHAQDDLDETAEEMIHYANQGAKHMQALIDGLLTFSRIDAEQTTLTPTDANQVLNDVLTSLQARINETDATITTETLPNVNADETHLAHVFQNLITNAIKFTKPGQPPRIRIHAHPEGNQHRIHIQDDGIGMDPQHATELFQLFHQGDQTKSQEGQGIGLAICKKIIDHHGGTISIDTKPGHGTTVSFTLPTTHNPEQPN